MPANLTELIAELNTTDLAWQASARCAEAFYGDLFFPEVGEGQGRRIEHARTLCRDCGVRDECLTYAVDNRIRDGIWGGLTRPEREKTKRGAA